MNDVYLEKDKINAPFLLAASFNGLVKFIGCHTNNGVVVWQFTPKDKSVELIEQLETKTEPHIPSKDLFHAIETFWKKVAITKNEEMQIYARNGNRNIRN